MFADTRIESLETQVRTLKRVLYTLCGVGVLGGLLAATNLNSVPDVIQAKKFEVVNDEGKVVASFYANMGGGMLSVSNKDGEVVVGLGSDEVNGGGVLGINNKDGKRVAGIHADEKGGVARVFNNKFTEVVVISADANGGVLDVSNKDGQQVASLSANAIGMGRLSVRNKDGKPVAAVFANPDGGGRLSIRNKDGQPVALISSNADGDGEIKTANSKGQNTSETP